ncbi:SUMO-activating enzyme subunit 2-like protein, partial [Leptotrombidium deliense]
MAEVRESLSTEKMCPHDSVAREVLKDDDLVDSMEQCKILLVGGGGIGCEVIKNLLLTGFKNVVVIDLDTIDVSNLNRQFLFNKSHVGQSKAKVAASVAVNNFAHSTDVHIEPIHNSIQSPEYSVNYFKSFSLVINALDNRAARSHVNRMCLAANVPLIESGSEGYLGQVFTIRKSLSACYECDGPKPDQRTFASCTIRNTPSLPIHCIVWGKHLFAQLFGEEDADNDVSPDLNDSEIASTVEALAGEQKVPSTREWAQQNDYNPKELFQKLFFVDIQYLLKMDQLWEKRRKPTPLTVTEVEKEVLICQPSSSKSAEATNGISFIPLKDQRLWSLKECYDVFAESLMELKKRLNVEKSLIWDKDDDCALNFVTAVSNLRSHCFGIDMKSKFDVKSMAGNIIPAISSTNSIVGGLITLQALQLLKRLKSENAEKNDVEVKNCKQMYLRKVSLSARNLIACYERDPPNKQCLVCSGRVPEIDITLSLSETLMSDFIEQVLFKRLNFVCPDIMIDGTATILWSKDESEEESDEWKEAFRTKLMSDFKVIKNEVRLKINDLIQDYTCIISLNDGKVDPKDNDGLWYKMSVSDEEFKAEINKANSEPEVSGTQIEMVEIEDSSDNIKASK